MNPIRKSGVFLFFEISGYSVVGNMRALGAWDRQFESGYPDQQEVSEWLKLPALETGDGTKVVSSVGSNPTFLTTETVLEFFIGIEEA